MRIDNPDIKAATGTSLVLSGALTANGNATLGDAEATDTHSIKGATTLLANSASAALTVTQTGAGNAFVVEDSASPDSTPFVIDGTGNVFIGQATSAISASPEAVNITNNAVTVAQNLLGMQYAGNNAVAPELNIYKARGTVASKLVVASGDGLANLQGYGYDGTNYIKAAVISVQVDGTPGTNDMPGRLMFLTTADGASSPTERMRIDSAGNLGIGMTAGATSKIAIATTDTAGYVGMEHSSNTGVKASILRFYRNRTTGGSVQQGDALGHIDFQGQSSGTFPIDHHISCFVDGTPGANALPTRLVFYTIADGASTSTERMRIDSAGNVGIGGASFAGAKAYVNGSATGATAAYGVISGQTVASDVTSQFNAFHSSPVTANTAFTLASFRHFYAVPGAKGAASTITSQYGFSAESGITDAVNNYGFYSNIASAANRYNFYAAGTANNYFAGATLCGSYLHAWAATATPAGGAVSNAVFLGSAGIGVYFGSGAPTVSAAKGSLYLRSDGSDGQTRTYINSNGTTGWTALASVEGISGGTF